MRAIISVFDKTDVVPLAEGLAGLGVELFSTSKTKKIIEEAGVDVYDVSQITGFPEILDGRVKTLHPHVFAGILARRDKGSHVAQMQQRALNFIDIVVCNLYPFEQTIAKPGVELDEALEMIDIGGPSMVRAAAKNFADVLVLVNPKRYMDVLLELSQLGSVSIETRKLLATEAFQHTAYYDSVVAHYLSKGNPTLFPAELTIGLRKVQDLRYGENPHQKAAFYSDGLPAGLSAMTQHQGKELSFTNILDVEAALRFVCAAVQPTVAIIKHVNPCGVAERQSALEAFKAAQGSDPLSAYGGIIGVNKEVDAAFAEEITKTFFEVVAAPSFTTDALEVFKKKEKLRVLEMTDWKSLGRSGDGVCFPQDFDVRKVRGGMLVQTVDPVSDDSTLFEVISKRKPTDKEMADLLFAWNIVGHVKSNAVVFTKQKAVVGIGAGQMSRVVSVEIAVKKAGEHAQGSVMASDAFFPFADGVEVAAKAGVTAVIHPGGSIRDGEVVAMADRYDMAMVRTNVRHFLH
ncbi:MAG: bifunctional phosphoribosylaminoimidazolecarboxamide formyltransferase/IMP cyclohydrolase [bacterium]